MKKKDYDKKKKELKDLESKKEYFEKVQDQYKKIDELNKKLEAYKNKYNNLTKGNDKPDFYYHQEFWDIVRDKEYTEFEINNEKWQQNLLTNENQIESIYKAIANLKQELEKYEKE